MKKFAEDIINKESRFDACIRFLEAAVNFELKGDEGVEIFYITDGQGPALGSDRIRFEIAGQQVYVLARKMPAELLLEVVENLSELNILEEDVYLGDSPAEDDYSYQPFQKDLLVKKVQANLLGEKILAGDGSARIGLLKKLDEGINEKLRFGRTEFRRGEEHFVAQELCNLVQEFTGGLYIDSLTVNGSHVIIKFYNGVTVQGCFPELEEQSRKFIKREAVERRIFLAAAWELLRDDVDVRFPLGVKEEEGILDTEVLNRIKGKIEDFLKVSAIRLYSRDLIIHLPSGGECGLFNEPEWREHLNALR